MLPTGRDGATSAPGLTLSARSFCRSHLRRTRSKGLSAVGFVAGLALQTGYARERPSPWVMTGRSDQKENSLPRGPWMSEACFSRPTLSVYSSTLKKT